MSRTCRSAAFHSRCTMASRLPLTRFGFCGAFFLPGGGTFDKGRAGGFELFMARRAGVTADARANARRLRRLEKMDDGDLVWLRERRETAGPSDAILEHAVTLPKRRYAVNAYFPILGFFTPWRQESFPAFHRPAPA